MKRLLKCLGQQYVGVRKFEPTGLTIAIILSESHLTAHFTPNGKYGSYIAVNAFTCGRVCETEKAIQYLVDILKPTEVNKQIIERGVR